MRIYNLIFLAVILLFAACTNAPEGKAVEAGEAAEVTEVAGNVDTLSVDLDQSSIHWVGTEPGDEGHNGSINIKSGYLLVGDETVKGGEFVIDMTSINVMDLEGEYKGKLEGHLKTGDFFEVEKFPEAVFTITSTSVEDQDSVYTSLITGNLTMKDETKAIEIPAKISLKDGGVTAETPQFTIDRTQWGIVFKSGIIGTVKDQLIDDQIGLQINLAAK